MIPTHTSLKDRRGFRWLMLSLVSITMLWFYYLTDALAPLQTRLEIALSWNAADYGLYSGAYGWFNVFLLMLVFGGMILDKTGIRFTGILSILLMLVGAGIKYGAISGRVGSEIVSLHIGPWTLITAHQSALIAGLGFAIFGIGAEMFGLTANKAIIRWFKGKELALAIGLNISVGRIGTALALFTPVPLVAWSRNLAAPILLFLLLMSLGLLCFILFTVFDRKLDREPSLNPSAGEEGEEEEFKFSDILSILRIKAFWIITLLCLLFYSALFPFIKYATLLMVQKFGLSDTSAGLLPALLPLGALVLTPLFGHLCDRKGKGATIMIAGTTLLLAVHLLFSVPTLNSLPIALALILLLALAFSLVPAALWPSMAKIIPEQRIGTAYAITFWVQNWGTMGVPMLIGTVLNRYCVVGTKETIIDGAPLQVTLYNYTLPMLLFACFGALAIFFAVWLKREDARKGYGLEQPNFS
jgi:nitrate/nitrite transporter NarK